ncbi:MAG: NAD(P)H-hydrate dehydratase [Gemmatimonadaceae bacterium]
MPGALVLAGLAALRSGAGKLQLATCASVSHMVAIAVPEALVVSLPETRAGGIAGRLTASLRVYAESATAVLVGPGMQEEGSVEPLVAGVVRAMTASTLASATLVVDAAGLRALGRRPKLLHPLGGRAVITPHSGEMASLLDVDKHVVESDPLAHALRAAVELRAIVALKGAVTVVAVPDGRAFRYARGGVGLATSGSGDVLAGIVVGLAARGATALDAALCGVYLHGEAGNRLARRTGPIGFLARDLPGEIPTLLQTAG